MQINAVKPESNAVLPEPDAGQPVPMRLNTCVVDTVLNRSV